MRWMANRRVTDGYVADLITVSADLLQDPTMHTAGPAPSPMLSSEARLQMTVGVRPPGYGAWHGS